MVYSNLRMAFLYELMVGAACILGLAFIGEIMIILLALMGFRPMILEKKAVRDIAPYRRFYTQVSMLSIIITETTLILLMLFSSKLGSPLFADGLNAGFLVSVAVSAFLFFQGTVALASLKRSGMN